MINPNEYGSLLYNKEEEQNLINVINARRIFRYSRTTFDYVSQFETSVCELMDIKHCLGVINGTAGLITALVAVDIKKGDKVLVSAYTYQASALAVLAVGAIPIPVEVDFNTGIDLEDVKRNLCHECKAIIVTHFQGRCFNLDSLSRFAKSKGLVLIEDACQAFGAKYKGDFAGCQSDIGVFSFQQFKQVSAGEGGAIVTNHTERFNRARNYTDMGAVRDHFPDWNADDTIIGQNLRMNQLCGAILCAQLNKFDYMIKTQLISRDGIYAMLDDCVSEVIDSKDPCGDTGMNILLAINGKLYKDAVKLAKEKDIEIRRMWGDAYFNNNLFRRNGLLDTDLREKECWKSRFLANTMCVVSIPPILTKEDESVLADFINFLYKNNFMDPTLKKIMVGETDN